jgi:hypothetical protein
MASGLSKQKLSNVDHGANEEAATGCGHIFLITRHTYARARDGLIQKPVRIRSHN